MKSYLSLIPISARVRKKQNRLTIICIILSVFLVTTIFSMADMWLRTEKEQLISRHGNYHIIINNIPENIANSIGARSDVAVLAQRNTINYDKEKDFYIGGYYVDNKNVVLYSADKSYISEIMNYSVEGDYPKNNNEIMISGDSKELLGIKKGDKIILNTQFGNFEYAVSGFCFDDSEFNEIIDGMCIYLSKESFYNLQKLDNKANLSYYVQFSSESNLRESIDDIKEQYGLSNENISENTFVLGLLGASNNSNFKNIYSLAAVFFILILISGVLMISSCMNSNIAQRTKFFGMLRCIGASRQQIIRFVRLEALNWCKIAVPIGCSLGVLITLALCLILHFMVKGEFADIPIFGISAVGIVSGVAVGVVTVLIAAHSPAKRAAKVSPMAAVSGNNDSIKNTSHSVNTRLFKVETALGIKHAVSAKKNFILITLSFAFTIILFLSFSACLDIAKRLIPSLNNYNPDISIVSSENINSIDKNVIDRIKDIPEVENVFGNMFSLDAPAQINGNETSIDLISYDNYLLNRYEKSILSGDLSKVYGNSNYAMAIFNQDTHISVGDKIKIKDNDIEIACVASEGIGGAGNTTIVCSEETFTRITGEKDYILINAELSDNASDKTIKSIQYLAGENEFEDRRDDNKEIYSSYWVFRLAAYGFLTIIILITIFNIMNSISMSVSARIKQYGSMRAVGMSTRQLIKTIAAEAITYALSGCIVGCVFGLYIHSLLIGTVISRFGGIWTVPFIPIAIILLIVLFSCAAAVYSPAKRITDMEITNTINEL